MPPLRTLFAGLCLATILAPGAEARSHHFSMPQRHIHANSPYGHIRGYVPAMDEHDPRYVASEQKCQTKASMGALSKSNSGSATTTVGSSHLRFFAECMVTEGMWRTQSSSNTGDRIGN
ncbi:hypothetical protein [Komagataeibacter europaeus]|uniref:hypothetical protein n=1 Tax=Komagataeibacter europaeus TaxID=33995 RepID=UPI000306E267|nr:hypothetical protein [Komagataeibacter europaeus]